jgi:hypothetical protein
LGGKYLAILFSAFLWARTGRALNYAELTKTIRDHQVRSIDELLPLLPENYRKNYTFVYQSRSLQAPAVSPQWPRTILYGEDAKFLMAFTKNPATPPESQLEDSLETIEFNEAKSVFQFRLIPFAPGKDPLATEPEINPVLCKGCHGTDPRPNWDAYNMWPGVYGSVSRLGCDTMQEGTAELKNYLAFLAGNRKRDRYQFLPPETLGRQENTGCPRTPDHDYTFSNAAVMDPNAQLTSQLFGLNARRIKRLVTESPSFPIFKYLWAGLAKNCMGDVDKFFPPRYVAEKKLADFDTTKRALKESTRQEFSVRLQTFQVNNAGSQIEPARTPINFLDDADPVPGKYSQLEPTAWIKFVADRAGISTERWETGFSDSHWNFSTSDGGPLDMFRNWSVPGVGYRDCDGLAAKSVEALSTQKQTSE